MKPDMAAMKRFKSLRDLAPDSPAMTLFQDTINLCVDLFKLSMASMLSVFVPQECPASEDVYVPGNVGTTAGDYVGPAVASFEVRSDGCSNNPAPHDCSFNENFICLTRLNRFVLSWNFICLGVLIFHYFLVWRREHFLIKSAKHKHTAHTLGGVIGNIRDLYQPRQQLSITQRNLHSSFSLSFSCFFPPLQQLQRDFDVGSSSRS